MILIYMGESGLSFLLIENAPYLLNTLPLFVQCVNSECNDQIYYELHIIPSNNM